MTGSSREAKLVTNPTFKQPKGRKRNNRFKGDYFKKRMREIQRNLPRW